MTAQAASFNAARIAPRDRFAEWNRALRRNFGHYLSQFGLPATAFRGEMELRCFGHLHLLRIRQDCRCLRRPRRSHGRGELDGYFLVVQLQGGCVARQLSAEAVLGVGGMVLIDSQLPATYRFEPDSLQLVVHLPREIVQSRAGAATPDIVKPLAAARSSEVSRLLESAWEQAGKATAAQSLAQEQALLALLFDAAPVAPVSSAASVVDRNAQRQTLALLREYALLHLADPGLSPKSIAAAHGITVRHVHRLFAATGTTFGHWVRHERLQRCASALRDQGSDGKGSDGKRSDGKRSDGVFAVAQRWGFTDAAHFSRIFRAAFGVPPRRYRAQFS